MQHKIRYGEELERQNMEDSGEVICQVGTESLPGEGRFSDSARLSFIPVRIH